MNAEWGKWTLYESSICIPLIMRVPGSTFGSPSRAIVESVDMYPTLVELCELDAPPQELEGLSFAPLLESPDLPWKSAAFASYKRSDRAPDGPALRAIRAAQYKYIESDTFAFQLFDLDDDPDEVVHLAPSRPDLVEDLRAQLYAGWRAAVPS